MKELASFWKNFPGTKQPAWTTDINSPQFKAFEVAAKKFKSYEIQLKKGKLDADGNSIMVWGRRSTGPKEGINLYGRGEGKGFVVVKYSPSNGIAEETTVTPDELNALFH